jgi:hypothetical protein
MLTDSKISESEIPQYTIDDVNEPYRKAASWHFEDEFISGCEPLFDNCSSNYEVRAKLEEAGVIHHNNRAEAETSALWIKFSTEKSAQNFIDRLNEYLRNRAEKINNMIEEL